MIITFTKESVSALAQVSLGGEVQYGLKGESITFLCGSDSQAGSEFSFATLGDATFGLGRGLSSPIALLVVLL